MIFLKWLHIDKIDRFMTYAAHVSAVAVASLVVLGAVVSCTDSVSAAEISDTAAIDAYLDASTTRANALDLELSRDSGGDISLKLSVLGLQRQALSAQAGVYENLDFSTAPDSFPVSGSGGAFLFLDANNVKHTGHIYAPSGVFDFRSRPAPYDMGTVVFSDLFNVHLYNALGSNSGRVTFSSSGVSFGASAIEGGNGWAAFRFVDTLGYLNTYSYTQNNINIGNTFNIAQMANNITSGLPGSQWSFNRSVYFSSYTLPSGDSPTISPWNYYNNVILPYIRQNYNFTDIDTYLYFPGGYEPQEPVVPPGIDVDINAGAGAIIMGAGAVIDGIDVFAPISGQLTLDGVNFQFTNSGDVYINGGKSDLQPITIDNHDITFENNNEFSFDNNTIKINADGTITINGIIYNLPVGQPSTENPSAPSWVYSQPIPTMETLQIPKATLSFPDFSSYSDSVSFVWDSIYKILTDSGLFPVVIGIFALASISFALYRLGG